MPVEVSFHLSCDVCRDYVAWAPSMSYPIALGLAKTLGWHVQDVTDPDNRRWEYKAYIQCPLCWEKNVGRVE